MAALSYDSPAILKTFAARRHISFPLLSDAGSAVIRRFGLLNTEFGPDSLAYGVPHPVTFVADAAGVVRSKYAERAYAERRTAASALVLAGEAPQVRAAEVRAPHVRARLGASNADVFPGERVTLVVDLELEHGWHAYAPGAKEYRVLALRLDPQPLLKTVHAPVYPPSRAFYFAPLDETVPVFEGSLRLLQDLTLGGGKDFDEFLKDGARDLVLTGGLDYQVCSEKLCLPPSRLPVQLTLRALPLDRTRAPEGVRHEPPK